MTIGITLTDGQAKAAQKFDPRQTVTAIVQVHVDTWLAPYVGEASKAERLAVSDAYSKADSTVQASVKALLGVTLSAQADAALVEIISG